MDSDYVPLEYNCSLVSELLGISSWISSNSYTLEVAYCSCSSSRDHTIFSTISQCLPSHLAKAAF